MGTKRGRSGKQLIPEHNLGSRFSAEEHDPESRSGVGLRAWWWWRSLFSMASVRARRCGFQSSLLACYSCQSGDLKVAWQGLEKAMDKGGDQIKLVALDEPELERLWVGIREG